MATVLNIKTDKLPSKYIYIGRADSPLHFGNPFTTVASGRGSVRVSTREQALLMFRQWLDGKVYQELLPERRQWILDRLHLLHDQTLVCHCKPLACHGDILSELAADRHAQKQRETEEFLNGIIESVSGTKPAPV